MMLVLVFALAGCKRSADPHSSAVSPSRRPDPVVRVSTPTTGTTEQSPTAAAQEAIRLLGPVDSPDASVRSGAAVSPDEVVPDNSEEEEEKKRKALAATEKAVTAAITARVAQLRACYERTSTGSTTVKVRIRVHRQGYVLDTTITGCNDAARNCMSGVLGQMRVSGMQTDTLTVERTFNLRARSVIRVTK